jgi:meiotically up-regulated gene 157 (Mug157) protein
VLLLVLLRLLGAAWCCCGQVYATTMSRVYSRANKYYFSGSALTGLGSPHTPANYVWPLATAMEALTSTNATRQAGLLKVGPLH